MTFPCGSFDCSLEKLDHNHIDSSNREGESEEKSVGEGENVGEMFAKQPQNLGMPGNRDFSCFFIYESRTLSYLTKLNLFDCFERPRLEIQLSNFTVKKCCFLSRHVLKGKTRNCVLSFRQPRPHPNQ